METLDKRKQIEVALLAGRVAYDALCLQGIVHQDLLRASFVQLIGDLQQLQEAIDGKKI